ncbi:MAG: Npun_F0813 family protein [Spirulina sp.]
MFILKRQDVEIVNIQHPKQEDRQIPVLKYQDQTFRLINIYDAAQAEEAKNFWKDLTDNQGKFCILLQEKKRHSIWERAQIDLLKEDVKTGENAIASASYIQASLLFLQAVYFDLEELLGGRQAKVFQKEMSKALAEKHIPQAETEEALDRLLEVDPLQDNFEVPLWQEQHLTLFLQETYRLGKSFFGNSNFVQGIEEVLQDMAEKDRQEFIDWLGRSSLGQEWEVTASNQ